MSRGSPALKERLVLRDLKDHRENRVSRAFRENRAPLDLQVKLVPLALRERRGRRETPENRVP